MDAGLDAGGEHITPFSKYVDRAKLTSGWKAHPASPSTVSNVANLPIGQSKKNLKAFLRDRLFPVNHDIRSVLFKSLVKRIPCNSSLFSAEMYKDFIAQNYPKISSYEEAPLPSYITDDKDIPSYCLNDFGKLELMKILACINYHFPQVTFCPILPPIVALFLHYDDSSSQVFTHTCHILFSNNRYIHYIDINKHDVEASMHVLRDLIQRFALSSHKSLVSLASDPDDIYCQWMKVLFCGLPLSYLVVLFDMYLLEGYKALFRCAISVLKFYRKVGMSNPSDILSAVFEFVKGISTRVSANLLFRKAHSLKLPTSKEIQKLHTKKVASILQMPIVGLDAEESVGRNPWTYIGMVRNVHSDIVNEQLLSNLYCWIPERYALRKPALLFSTNKNGYNMEAFFSATFDHNPTLLLIKTTDDAVIGAYLTSDWSERKGGQKSYFGTGETFIFTLVPKCTPHFWAGLKENAIKELNETSSNTSSASKITSSQKKSVKKSTRGVTLPPIHQGSTSPLPSPGNSSREASVVLPPLIGSPMSLEPSFTVSNSSIATSNSGVKTPVKSRAPNDLFMLAEENGIIIGGGNGYGIFIDKSFLHCTTERCDTFDNNPLVPGCTFQCSVVELFGFES